ncbi:unnamed protein product [Ascophyllum nodosum]
MKICKRMMKIFMISFMFIFSPLTLSIEISQAYPIYAQQSYTNPRAANGRLACANCHLVEKPIQIESPGAILPNKVFEAAVKIPYPQDAKQILGNGQLSGLNVGAVVILPEGFK